MGADDNETLAGMMAAVVGYHHAARLKDAADRLRSIAGPDVGAEGVMAAVMRRIVARERERVLRSAYLTLSGGTSSSRPEYVHADMRLRLAALEGICEIGPDVIREYASGTEK